MSALFSPSSQAPVSTGLPRTERLVRRPHYDTGVRPFLAIWETTQACDLACRHCRADARPHHDPLELSTAEGYALIDDLAGLGTPRPLFVLTGGDPFKRADLLSLTRYAAGRGLPVALSPSGTPLLTEENLAAIKAAGAKAVSLSLDASTPERHDAFRGVPGSFALTENGWRAARRVGLKVQINTTITRQTLDDLPALFSRVREIGAMTWSLFFLVPTGRGQAADEISPAEYEDVLHVLYDASKYVSLKTTEGHHYKRIVLQRTALEHAGLDAEAVLPLGDTYRRLRAGLDAATGGEAPPRDALRRTPMHLNSGEGFVFISHRGEVFPSGFLPLSAGNVRQQPLSTLYAESPLFQTLRDTTRLKGRCGACEYASVCGGSRSRAFAMTGDPLAEEPFCVYQPGSFGALLAAHGLLAN